MDVTRVSNRSTRVGVRVDAPWLATFLGCLLLLLYTALKTPGLILFLAVIAAYTYHVRRSLLRALLPAAPLLLLPGLALLSVLWSDARDMTLRAGVQYAITFYYAILIARTVPSRTIISALLYALSLTAALCLVELPHALKIHQAMQGIFDSKNSLAFAAATLLLTAFGTAIDPTRRPNLRLFAMINIPLALGLVVMAQSAGAFVSTAIAAVILLMTNVLARVGPSVRLAGLLLVMACVPVLIVARPTLEATWGDIQQNALHKDATLTGRTYLWQKADAVAAERPILGHGYSAFWRQGSPDAEGLWAYMGIPGRTGFNFHNQYRELRVDLGWTGVIVFFGVLAASLGYYVTRLFVLPSHTVSLMFSLLFSFALRIPVESLLYYQFSTLSVLYVMFCCVGISGPVRKGGAAPPKQVRRYKVRKRHVSPEQGLRPSTAIG